MGNQMTEMLKGTLEGIVLAILAGTAGVRVRDHGAAEGAGLHRPRRRNRLRPARPHRADGASWTWRRSPPRRARRARCTRSTPRARTARRVLEDVELPRRTYRTAPQKSQKERTDMAAKWIEIPHRVARAEEAVQAGHGPHRGAARAVPHRREGGAPVPHVLGGHRRRRHRSSQMFGDLADLWERAAADGTPVREIVGDDPVEFAETFAQATRASSGSTRSAPA